jgi:hypothetical protein
MSGGSSGTGIGMIEWQTRVSSLCVSVCYMIPLIDYEYDLFPFFFFCYVFTAVSLVKNQTTAHPIFGLIGLFLKISLVIVTASVPNQITRRQRKQKIKLAYSSSFKIPFSLVHN